MNFLIVTGLSGAGKSMAVNALEDIGFFCIDNIPVALLPRIVDFALQGENQLNRVAVVMDVRGVRSIEKLQEALADLDEKKIDYDILSWMPTMQPFSAAIRRRAASTRWPPPRKFPSPRPSRGNAAFCSRCAIRQNMSLTRRCSRRRRTGSGCAACSWTRAKARWS